jgi:flagellar biogenesis protein FliO
MSRGWSVFVLFLILGMATAFAVDPISQTEEPATSGDRSLPQPEPFSAERFSQTYDRIAHQTDRKPMADQPLVSVSGLEVVPFVGKTILSLLVILGLIYGLSQLLKKWNGGVLLSTAGPLKVLARQTLSSKSTIYVVAAMDRFLIIGENTQGLSCLSQFDDSEENRKIRETWGWDGMGTRERNRLYSPPTSPFRPTLQSHVEEIEREISRLQEVT